jgi:hypothetical protein
MMFPVVMSFFYLSPCSFQPHLRRTFHRVLPDSAPAGSACRSHAAPPPPRASFIVGVGRCPPSPHIVGTNPLTDNTAVPLPLVDVYLLI